MPRMHIAASDKGITVERARTRQSLAVLRFGLQVEVEAYRACDLQVGQAQGLDVGQVVKCNHHTRLIDPDGATVDLEALRKQAIKAGGRFRIDNKRKRFRVSNDPSALGKGDLLFKAYMRLISEPENQVLLPSLSDGVELVRTQGL